MLLSPWWRGQGGVGAEPTSRCRSEFSCSVRKGNGARFAALRCSQASLTSPRTQRPYATQSGTKINPFLSVALTAGADRYAGACRVADPLDEYLT